MKTEIFITKNGKNVKFKRKPEIRVKKPKNYRKEWNRISITDCLYLYNCFNKTNLELSSQNYWKACDWFIKSEEYEQKRIIEFFKQMC